MTTRFKSRLNKNIPDNQSSESEESLKGTKVIGVLMQLLAICLGVSNSLNVEYASDRLNIERFIIIFLILGATILL